jgi:hypothetical protein
MLEDKSTPGPWNGWKVTSIEKLHGLNEIRTIVLQPTTLPVLPIFILKDMKTRLISGLIL